MQFDYQGHANVGGIYQIKNNNNNKIYIGSAAIFKTRWAGHKKELESGKHPNKHLQAAYNIDGDSPWHFTVLEVVVAETKEAGKIARKAAEQVWIDKYFDNCVNCYNIKKKADTSREDVPSKDPLKTAELLSIHSTKMWQDPAYRDNLITKRNDPVIRERQKTAAREWNLDPVNYDRQKQLLNDNHAIAIETRKRKNKERMDAILLLNPNHFEDQKALYASRRSIYYQNEKRKKALLSSK